MPNVELFYRNLFHKISRIDNQILLKFNKPKHHKLYMCLFHEIKSELIIVTAYVWDVYNLIALRVRQQNRK